MVEAGEERHISWLHQAYKVWQSHQVSWILAGKHQLHHAGFCRERPKSPAHIKLLIWTLSFGLFSLFNYIYKPPACKANRMQNITVSLTQDRNERYCGLMACVYYKDGRQGRTEKHV